MKRQVSGWTTGVAVVAVIFASMALWATVAGAQEGRSDLRDFREDRRAVRQDTREVRQDGRDMYRDRHALRKAMASGNHEAAARARRDLRADHRQLRRDVHARRWDVRDLHDNQHGLRWRHGLYRDAHDRRAG